jgi:hypothetical protein
MMLSDKYYPGQLRRYADAVHAHLGDDPSDAYPPAPWVRGKKVYSDHDMWSYIEDERGIKRVAIFYKAAFYDRSAYMHLQSLPGSMMGSVDYYGPSELDRVPWDKLTDQERADCYAYLAERRVQCQAELDRCSSSNYGWTDQQQTYFVAEETKKLVNIDNTLAEMAIRGWTNPFAQ